MKESIWIGFDPREQEAFDVARGSVLRRLSRFIPVHQVHLGDLRQKGLYTRPTETWNGKLWDVISAAPMSTEHANARFIVPVIQPDGYALFMDCDILCLDDIAKVFDFCARDPSKAVWVVKHHYEPPPGTKMDGQVQSPYARKNWSSFTVWNCDHPATKRLTLDMVNSLPGRDLHRFASFSDDEIGELGPEWNHLVGHSRAGTVPPKIIHFTEGLPTMAGYEDCEFAQEWRQERAALNHA